MFFDDHGFPHFHARHAASPGQSSIGGELEENWRRAAPVRHF
jgi:hypothetical protein